MIKKNETKWYAVLGFLCLLITIIIFAVPTAKVATLWIAYAFTVLAFVVLACILKVVLNQEMPLKSKVLNFPIVYVGVIYVLTQVVAIVVFMFMPDLPTWSAIVTEVVITFASWACMLFYSAGQKKIL